MTGKQHETPTDAQQQAISQTGTSHRSLVTAQNSLFRALGRAAPLREREWAARVAEALDEARRCIASHRASVEGHGGLYDELRFEAPWLLSRVQQLVNQLRRLEAEAEDLSIEVERVRQGDLEPLPRIRAEAELVLRSLREVMAKETDIIWERFNEPVALD
ncbi:MAG: hypothetical protein R3C29_04950 [Dehalococcoidia bacterium]